MNKCDDEVNGRQVRWLSLVKGGEARRRFTREAAATHARGSGDLRERQQRRMNDQVGAHVEVPSCVGAQPYAKKQRRYGEEGFRQIGKYVGIRT
eukprot:4703711-Pleurochrysis_carterae.AAC.1